MMTIKSALFVCAGLGLSAAVQAAAPCTGLPQSLNLQNLSYSSPRSVGNLMVQVDFPNLRRALCRSQSITGGEHFRFDFERGERPLLTVRNTQGYILQQQPIAMLRAIAYTGKDTDKSFLKVHADLSDLSTLTAYIHTHLLAENVEAGLPVVERPMSVTRP